MSLDSTSSDHIPRSPAHFHHTPQLSTLSAETHRVRSHEGTQDPNPSKPIPHTLFHYSENSSTSDFIIIPRARSDSDATWEYASETDSPPPSDHHHALHTYDLSSAFDGPRISTISRAQTLPDATDALLAPIPSPHSHIAPLRLTYLLTDAVQQGSSLSPITCNLILAHDL
jgi:hypothetical protein